MVYSREPEQIIESLIKMVGQSHQTIIQLEKRVSILEHQRLIHENPHKIFILQKPVKTNIPE